MIILHQDATPFTAMNKPLADNYACHTMLLADGACLISCWKQAIASYEFHTIFWNNTSKPVFGEWPADRPSTSAGQKRADAHGGRQNALLESSPFGAVAVVLSLLMVLVVVVLVCSFLLILFAVFVWFPESCHDVPCRDSHKVASPCRRGQYRSPKTVSKAKRAEGQRQQLKGTSTQG